MNDLLNRLEEKVIPIASKVGNQRHLAAIRDSFTVIMPLMIIGAFAVAINNFDFFNFQSFMENLFPSMANDSLIWKSLGGNIWSASFAIISILMSFLIGYKLAESYKLNSLVGAVTSLSSYCALGGIGSGDAQGLFISIILSVISVEFLRKLYGMNFLHIKMPDSVPTGVADSFSNMLPMMITISVIALINTLLLGFGISNIFHVFYETFQKPFQALSNSLFSAIILAFIPPFLWFFGIHGANMIDPFMQSINITAVAENLERIEQGKEALNIVNKPFFDAFVNLGGTGATIGLIIAIFIIARKNKHLTTISAISLGPGLFNINEPMTFGIPIVLNPILFIPYVFGPVILTIIAYTATALSIVPAATIPIPWIAPPVIGGIMATQTISGGILALFNLIVITIIYIPFVSLINRVESKKSKE